MPSATLDMFTTDQRATVSDLLNAGMNPEQITAYLARLNDLDEVEEMFVNQLATDLASNGASHPTATSVLTP